MPVLRSDNRGINHGMPVLRGENRVYTTLMCLPGVRTGVYIHHMCLPEGSENRVYTPVCASLRGVHQGITSHICLPKGCTPGYTSLLSWYMPPSYYGGYTPPSLLYTLYTPGYTPYTPGTDCTPGPMSAHGGAQEEEALGSERRNPLGRRELCSYSSQ